MKSSPDATGAKHQTYRDTQHLYPTISPDDNPPGRLGVTSSEGASGRYPEQCVKPVKLKDHAIPKSRKQ